jgi:hypothetical protein
VHADKPEPGNKSVVWADWEYCRDCRFSLQKRLTGCEVRVIVVAEVPNVRSQLSQV